jgi:hypothetical protein
VRTVTTVHVNTRTCRAASDVHRPGACRRDKGQGSGSPTSRGAACGSANTGAPSAVRAACARSIGRSGAGRNRGTGRVNTCRRRPRGGLRRPRRFASYRLPKEDALGDALSGLRVARGQFWGNLAQARPLDAVSPSGQSRRPEDVTGSRRTVLPGLLIRGPQVQILPGAPWDVSGHRGRPITREAGSPWSDPA